MNRPWPGETMVAPQYVRGYRAVTALKIITGPNTFAHQWIVVVEGAGPLWQIYLVWHHAGAYKNTHIDIRSFTDYREAVAEAYKIWDGFYGSGDRSPSD